MNTQHYARKPRSVFEQSLPIVAAALGRLCGVTVEFGTQVPATDGKTIWMPLPETMAEADELKTLGILCHEAGHVRLTDFGDVAQKLTHLERAIDNALEDCRIEAAMGRLYPGAESLFRAAHAAKAEEIAGWKKFEEQTLLPLFLLAVSEERLLYRKWLSPLSTKLLVHMHRMFGKDLTEKLASLALEVKDAKSTADVTAIRRRIMRLLKREAARQESSQTKLESGGASKDASAAGKDYSSENGKTAQPSGSSSESDERSETALGRLLKPTIKPVVNPLDVSGNFKRLRPDEGVPGLTIDFSGRIRPVSANEETGVERLKRARKDSVALRLALRGLVQAQARVGHRISDRGRRLSTSHLCRLVVSDARVFRECADRHAPNAAVHILLDMSGSMGLAGGDLAVRSSLGLVMGLEGIRGVSPALTVFPGAACGHNQQAVCTVLRHGERLAKVSPGQVGGISSWGGTPLQEALQAGGFALAACKQAKKALILITDGRVGSQANQTVIDELQGVGIHVFGIQIGDADDLKNLTIESAHIRSVKDLQEALFGFAKKLLL